MDLSEKLQAYIGGWGANLEMGAFWAIFIGRLEQVEVRSDWIGLRFDQLELYRLNGEQLVPHPTYEVGWSPKHIQPFAPIETTTKLSTFVPYVTARLVFYRPEQPRPNFDQVKSDMRLFRHLG